MARLIEWFAQVVCGVVMACLAVTSAHAGDPHVIFEQRCARCHTPHASTFVHKNLVRSGSQIVGIETGEEIAKFLEAGHGTLAFSEVTLMVAHLTSIKASNRLFQRKCIICHDRAVKLARAELIIKDGELVGRYSNRNIELFLTGHGRLDAGEVARMVEVLKRHLRSAAAE